MVVIWGVVLTLIIDLISLDSVGIESFGIVSVHGLPYVHPSILVLYAVQFCPVIIKSLQSLQFIENVSLVNDEHLVGWYGLCFPHHARPCAISKSSRL